MSYATFQQQIDAAKKILEREPKTPNGELARLAEQELARLGTPLRGEGMSNSVFTKARSELGIVPTLGRPKGSKNKATLERKAAAEAKMKAIEAETTRSLNAALASTTGIFTGNERINVFHGPVAPTLAELLRPVEKLMRDRGISSITLDVDGLHVTRTITESVVL
jgi:hypothetical protein